MRVRYRFVRPAQSSCKSTVHARCRPVRSRVRHRTHAPWLHGSVVVFLLAMAGSPVLLGGCTPSDGGPQAAATAPAAPAFGPERLIGRWGVASFHADKDRARTEREARAQCKQPYAITKGPTDGVMMHVADDPKRYELRLKGNGAGRTFLGFEAPPGDPQDREIVSATDNVLVMRFVDPEVSQRYGTFVYVKCG